jgi:hypothetical protein
MLLSRRKLRRMLIKRRLLTRGTNAARFPVPRLALMIYVTVTATSSRFRILRQIDEFDSMIRAWQTKYF